MSPPITPARIRDLVEDTFTALARRGADDAALAATALHALGLLRRAIDRRAGRGARDQFDGWLHDLLLRRELRARHFDLAPGRLPPRDLDRIRALAAELLVETALAHAEAAGAPVLALALAEFLLERLEGHGGGMPPRRELLARLAEGRTVAGATDAGHALLH